MPESASSMDNLVKADSPHVIEVALLKSKDSIEEKNEMRVERALQALAIILCTISVCCAQSVRPFLSNLNATGNTPLYTTYAAAQQRSEFLLDEGYHFVFNDTTRGLEFATDKAGDLCIAFRKGSNFIHKLSDFWKGPIVTLSYPDIMHFSCFPAEGINAGVAFCTYSSRAASLEITLSNTGGTKTEIEFLPFLNNTYRVYNNIDKLPGEKRVVFACSVSEPTGQKGAGSY